MNPLCIVAAYGPGMGHAVAKRFAREGFDLALIARSPKSDAIEELRGFGGRVEAYACDLSDIAAAASAMAAVRARQGPAAALVYNAAAWSETAPLGQPVDAFHRDLALCVSGAYACAQAVLPDMRAAGAGTILFTGGGLALRPAYGQQVLSLVAGKSALRGLALALHEALKPEGLHAATVTIAGMVAPGGPFDPDRIAEAYWTLHAQARDEWTAEIVYSG